MRPVVRLGALLVLVLAVRPGAAADLGTDAQRDAGRQLYERYCAQCHGDKGDGQGHATPRVLPAPRDFTSGKYKIRTTPSGQLPTDDDLRKVIRDGLPYTSMPPWPDFTDDEVQNLIYHLKSFSAEFAQADPQPIEIPEPPQSTPESVERGKQIYGELGCAKCHGDLGRGDGPSAPTLLDDWGHPLRPADLTMRWTFRGGPTRRDVFRTFSTGLNGTPMPSYADALPVEDRWHLVDYIESLGDGEDPRYADLVVVRYVADEIDLGAADSLFADSPGVRFPLVGQIVEPGRDFVPATSSIVVRAVHNRRDVAIEVRWNDMRSDASGKNAPDLQVPLEEEQQVAPAAAPAGEETGDFWGEAAAPAPAAPAPGAPAQPSEDFWGEATDAPAAAAAGAAEFADAVAIQLPAALPAGIRKPYFIFGDPDNPVDLWFVDLAQGSVVQTFSGRGSASVTAAPGEEIAVVSSYDRGEWRVVFKRPARASSGVGLEEDRFVPIAFTVWDGTNRERGNKRGLSRWFYLYVEPSQKPSVAGPMARAALITLGIELLVIFLVRRAHARRRQSGEGRDSGGAVTEAGLAR